MNAHTPGPWKFTHLGNNGSGVYEHTESRGLKISQTLLGKTEPEIYANARIIAASPELLEFAKWAIWQLCGYSGTGETHWEQFKEFRKGKDAIAKAEGKQ